MGIRELFAAPAFPAPGLYAAEEREQWDIALREHVCEIGRLSRLLVELRNRTTPAEQAAAVRAQVVFVTAQIIRHRVGAALLEARLGTIEEG